MKVNFYIVVAALALVSSGAASASGVVYELTGTGSFTLGGKAFDGAFDFVATGNTNDVQTSSLGAIVNNYPMPGDLTETITLAGEGTFDAIGQVYVFFYQSSGVGGFGGLPGGDTIDFSSSIPSSYALASSIGPVSVSGFAGNQTLKTTGGGLTFSSVSDVTFRSVLSSVPEPATWAMMLVGFGGLGGMMRTRLRQVATSA